MNPSPFAFHRATSVQDAISLVSTLDNAKIIAGGHSLLPVMKLRLAEPDHLVDITGIPGLRGVAERNEAIEIGALTTHRDLATSVIIERAVPMLAEAALAVGDNQVRNRGTIGGALAHADAAADYPAVMLAADAVMIAESAKGRREIPAEEFFLGFLTTALGPEELLVGIRINVPAAGTGSAYEKLANQASGYAIVGVAASVTVSGAGSISAAKIGLTGATASAVRIPACEAALVGRTPSADVIAHAAAFAPEGLELLDDLHASTAYRERVVRGLTARAITRAVASAQRKGR